MPRHCEPGYAQLGEADYPRIAYKLARAEFLSHSPEQQKEIRANAYRLAARSPWSVLARFVKRGLYD